MAKLTGLEAIESQKIFLKFFGIWPLEHESLLYNLRYYITCGICFGFTAIPALEMPNHFDDYGALSELVGVLVSPLVFCLKIVTFKNSKYYLLRLLRNMEKHSVDAFEADMLKAFKLSKRLIILYPAWYILSVTVFLLQPVLGKQDLPVRFSYNLGRFKYLMYAYQVLGLGIVGAGLAFLDSLTINLMNIGLAKLEILAKKIKNVDSTLPKNMISKEFSEIIATHKGIIKYFYYLEQVFTYCFLAQFFNSIVAICNIALQLAHVDIQTVEFAAMAMYFCAMLFELALYCWFGNEVIIKSQKILQACYECRWYEFDTAIRKSIFITMERSKRPIQLTAVKFTTLSLESFSTIIRKSYSFFTVMQQMYSKDNEEH